MLAAGGAEAQDVEAVAMGLEALGAGEVADGLGDAVLDAGGQGDVGDFPAADTDQVVVVSGQVLGELEPGELVIGGDAADQPGGFQVGQVPVSGAARQAWKPVGDIADADRMASADEQADDRPPPAGVALIDTAQPSLHHAVQVAGRIVGWHRPPHELPGTPARTGRLPFPSWPAEEAVIIVPSCQNPLRHPGRRAVMVGTCCSASGLGRRPGGPAWGSPYGSGTPRSCRPDPASYKHMLIYLCKRPEGAPIAAAWRCRSQVALRLSLRICFRPWVTKHGSH